MTTDCTVDTLHSFCIDLYYFCSICVVLVIVGYVCIDVLYNIIIVLCAMWGVTV